LQPLPRKIFTLEIDGKPTLALEAHDIGFARGICALSDFRLDLSEITSGGVTVCPANSEFKLRLATKKEVAAFNRAIALAPREDDFTFVFLIAVDRVVASYGQADESCLDFAAMPVRT
jgi:hypothetical protein